MKLFGYWRSSASWRVRWALALKQLSYDYIPVNLLTGENKKPEHLARNPLGAVPVLEIESGVFLSESLAIFEWLEEAFPQTTRIFPGTPKERAQIRSLCEIINSETAPLQTPRAQKRHSQDPLEQKKWAQDFIHQGLSAYAALCEGLCGEFSVGSQVSAADLCLIPQIYNALRYEIPVATEFPTLSNIYQRCLKNPACHQSAPEQQTDALRF